MKKIFFLSLMFLSFSANIFAQKKETKSLTPKVQTGKEKTVKRTLTSKKINATLKNVEGATKDKKTFVVKNPQPKSNTNIPEKKIAKDTVKTKNVGLEKRADTQKITQTVIPENASTTNGDDSSNGKQTNTSSFNFLSILPYGLSALLGGLLLLVFARSKKKIETLESELKQNRHAGSYSLNNLTDQIKVLESEKSDLMQKQDGLIEELRQERKKNKVLFEFEAVNELAKQPENIPTVVQESPIKYARYADQGDGFTASDLLSEEDNDTIFEITITSPNTATFKVANNLNAQRSALSNAAYLLGKTCKYDSTPLQNSIIRTDNLGDLKLQGNKWLILNPVKISFT